MIFETGYDDRDNTVFKQHCPLLTEQTSEKDANIQQTIEHNQDSSPVDYGNQQKVEQPPGRSGDCSPEDYERQQSRERQNNFSRDEYGNQQTAEQSSERRYNKSVAQIGSQQTTIVKSGIHQRVSSGKKSPENSVVTSKAGIDLFHINLYSDQFLIHFVFQFPDQQMIDEVA